MRKVAHCGTAVHIAGRLSDAQGDFGRDLDTSSYVGRQSDSLSVAGRHSDIWRAPSVQISPGNASRVQISPGNATQTAAYQLGTSLPGKHEQHEHAAQSSKGHDGGKQHKRPIASLHRGDNDILRGPLERSHDRCDRTHADRTPSCWKVLKTELPSVRIDSGSAPKPFVIVVLKPKPWPIPKST